MMPVLTHFDHLIEDHTDSQSRRLAILNRARREEIDAMIFSAPPRHTVTRTGSSARKHRSSLGRVVNRMRDGIGDTLISAGNRIQSRA
jgi:hypothetical protein